MWTYINIIFKCVIIKNLYNSNKYSFYVLWHARLCWTKEILLFGVVPVRREFNFAMWPIQLRFRFLYSSFPSSLVPPLSLLSADLSIPL